MKRLWISLTLLILLFCSSVAKTLYLSSFTRELTDLLHQAEVLGEAEKWEPALVLTRQAQNRWDSHSIYLHTTLRHADIDNVYLFFLQVEEFLNCHEGGEYSAANAALIGHLTLLREQEELSIKNIL